MAQHGKCPFFLVQKHSILLQVTTVLLDAGAAPNQGLSTRYDKMTALMLAAANSDLALVQLLVGRGAKVEQGDRYKRTALTHAVMNGGANVASYLLSIGRFTLISAFKKPLTK